jgi:hypothetical protein
MNRRAFFKSIALLAFATIVPYGQIDNEFHGVYEMVGADGNPVNANKGRIWKAAYHDGRALLNVSERLRRLAGAAAR